MKYEIVELKEKTIVGFAANTSNDDPEMTNIIGGLWKKLYEPNHVSQILNRSNQYSIGLYSDYTEDGYCVTAGFEVDSLASDKDAKHGDTYEGFTVKTIPAGRYAKFSIHGDCVEAVGACWQEIWQMPLDRTYTGDFEEYTSMEDIDIYIAIRR